MVNKYKDWLSIKDKYKNIYPQGHLNIHSYRNGLITEGEGLNFEIFTQGCLRYCPGCRNAEQSDVLLRKPVDVKQMAQIVTGNASVPVNRREKVINADQLLEKLFLLHLEGQVMSQKRLTLYESPFPKIPYRSFVRAWDKKQFLLNKLLFSLMQMEGPDKGTTRIPITGLTICGGEPLYQADSIMRFIKEVKKAYPLKIWLMTGFSFEDIIRYKEIRMLLECVDYLIDGCFLLDQMNLSHAMRGSMNQREIDVKKSLKLGRIVYWSPQYPWTQLFVPYWKKYSDPNRIHEYCPFSKAEDVSFYLMNSDKIKKISTVREYEMCFGDIRKGFEKRVLGSSSS